MTVDANGGAPASDELDRMFDEGAADEAAAGIPSMTTEGGEPDAQPQPDEPRQAPAKPREDDDWRREPQPEPQAKPEPATEPKPEPHSVPLSTLLDEREKRQTLERQLEDFRRREAEAEAKRKAEDDIGPEPDRWADPEGHDRWRDKQRQREEAARLSPVETRVREVTEYYSQQNAIREHGADLVKQANEALFAAAREGRINGTAVKAHLDKSLDPVGDVVRWYNDQPAIREKRMRDDIRKELEAEYAGRAPARSAETAAATAAAPPAQQGLPSLTRAAGSAGQPQGGSISEDDIFNSAPAFGRRRA